MRIMHILPELVEGGVERHVLMLSRLQIAAGHYVSVVSAGGKLVSQLASGIIHIRLPVHSKIPPIGFYCGVSLASLAREHKIDIMHAHSRVPAWVALISGRLTGIAYIVTAHAYFSTQTRWIYYPYRKADKVICVSRSVQTGMKNCFTDNTVVIKNGMPSLSEEWKGSSGLTTRFLFVGRLTELKGLQDIIKALPSFHGDWQLDVVGDGPSREQLEKLSQSFKLREKILFHGFQDNPDNWMAKSDCLFFPSHIEGMPLTLARAIQMGMPIIASDIEPVRELTLDHKGLIQPGDTDSWKNAIEEFLLTKKPVANFDKKAVPTIEQMAQGIQSLYESVLSQKAG